MIAKIFDATARHRRPILLGGAVVAVVEATLTALDPLSGARAIRLMAGVGVLLLLLAMSSFRQAPARTFLVRADLAAFVTPAAAGPVYAALAFLFLTADRVGRDVAGVHTDGMSSFDIILAFLQVILMSLLYVQAWIGFDISLRRDGLYDRRAFGTVFIPWQATPTAYVARRPDETATVVIPPGMVPAQDATSAGSRPTEVRMTYRHPELVRTRGLTRNVDRLTTNHVEASFLATAITFYANHPENRGAIGTVDGLRHLQNALTHPEQ
jgi:hypothetical protein